MLAFALVLAAAIFAADLILPTAWVIGAFYLVPLGLVAVACGRRTTAFVATLFLIVIFAAMVDQDELVKGQELIFLFFLAAAFIGLVVLADLLRQLDTVSQRATRRALFAEAEAAIVAQSIRGGRLRELAEAAIARIGEQLRADDAALLLVDGDEWVGFAGWNLGHDASELRVPREIFKEADDALRERHSLVLNDVPATVAATPRPHKGIIERYGLREVLLVPMLVVDAPLGVMAFNRRVAGGFTRDQVRFAESVAGHVAVALDNARLMAELQQKRRDLGLVVESSLDFAATLEPRDVVETIAARLADALKVSGCDIDVLEPQGDAVRTVVSYDSGEFVRELVGARWPLADYRTTRFVIETGQPLAIRDLDDPHVGEADRRLFESHGQRCQLGLPLKAHDRIIGVAELFDYGEARDFTFEEIELAEAICQFAALALENARLYDRVRAASLRLQQLQEVSLRLGRLRDERVVLDDVVRAAAELLEAGRVAYVVSDGEQQVVRAAIGVSRPVAEVEAGALEALRALLPRLTQFAGDEPRSSAQRAHAYDGALVVPLKRHRPDKVAALVFGDKIGGGAFSDDDQRLATTLAAQLSTSLRTIHEIEREHEIAEAFQAALLVPPPDVPGIDFGVRYKPATDLMRVGGDFYDVMSLAPGRLMIAIGDVCGRGLDAAVQTAMVRYTLRAFAPEGSPGETLARLNRAIVTQDPATPFVTIVLAYLDVRRRTLEFAVAGHPRPIVYVGGRRFHVSQDGGFPVSLFEPSVYPTNRFTLPPDATLVLYTDGVTEARDHGPQFGEKRLIDLVRRNLSLPAQSLADRIVDRAFAFSGEETRDDLAVVVVHLP